jgi:hypothetical protein
MKPKRYHHRPSQRPDTPDKRHQGRIERKVSHNVSIDVRQGGASAGGTGGGHMGPVLPLGCGTSLVSLLSVCVMLFGYHVVQGFRNLRSESELNSYDGIHIPLSLRDLVCAAAYVDSSPPITWMHHITGTGCPSPMSLVDDLPVGSVSEHLPAEFYVGQERDAWLRLEVDQMEVEKKVTLPLPGSSNTRIRLFGFRTIELPVPKVQSVVKIHVAPRMKATVVGKKDVFQITELQDATQITSAKDPTEWGWKIQALSPGEHTLDLVVSVVLSTEGTDSFRRVRRVPVKVIVTASTFWKVRQFWLKNWQYVLSTILIPLLVWAPSLWKKRRASKRHLLDDGLLVPVTRRQLVDKIIPKQLLTGLHLNFEHARRIKTVLFYVVSPYSEVSHLAEVSSATLDENQRSVGLTFSSITAMAGPLSCKSRRNAPKSVRYFRSKRLPHVRYLENLFDDS